jgi:hypothetical protein
MIGFIGGRSCTVEHARTLVMSRFIVPTWSNCSTGGEREKGEMNRVVCV